MSHLERPVWRAGAPGRALYADDQATGDPIFRSVPYLRAMARAERFARDRFATVLIEGESGTGKTRLARQMHRWSPRAAFPFAAVVLSTLDDSLASSEMFGHVSGAFTDARYARAGHFVTANGGTLFLDEIGKASLMVQQKLLHAVEYGEIRAVGSDRDVRIDVRILAATNTCLEHLVDAGDFLPDLYARLAAFRLKLPSLRDRRPDIPILAAQYLRLRATSCGYVQPPEIDAALMGALQKAPWPNNLRQLDATIHRILVDAEGAAVLTLDHCIDDLAYLREIVTSAAGPLTPQRVSDAMQKAGTVVGAARLLGVDRTTLHRFWRRQPPRAE